MAGLLVGFISFNVRFKRFFELDENKLTTVAQMHSLGWGESEGAWFAKMAYEVVRLGGGVDGGVCWAATINFFFAGWCGGSLDLEVTCFLVLHCG